MTVTAVPPGQPGPPLGPVRGSPAGMPARAVAPAAPGRLGRPADPEQVLAYLDALGRWRDQRRAELDRLDQAAQSVTSPDLSERHAPMTARGSDTSRGVPGLSERHAPMTARGSDRSAADALTPDILLSMALWKAVADRHDLLLATWDSGRVGRAELERIATLIWGRLDTTVDPRGPAPVALSLPEACRLSDTLAASLRVRLGIDDDAEDTAARLRALRAQLERIRDLVDADPTPDRDGSATALRRLDTRLADAADRARRGADVGGLVGPLDADAARLERDLIVAAARRTDDARDAELARATRAELAARGRAVADLAARCVARVFPAPRLAVPDVAALGPVPDDPAAVDAYLTRLGAVSRALGQAQMAYQAPLDEREELLGRLQGYAAKAAAAPGPSPQAREDLAELKRRGDAAFAAQPTDLRRARGVVAAYQAYLGASR